MNDINTTVKIDHADSKDHNRKRRKSECTEESGMRKFFEKRWKLDEDSDLKDDKHLIMKEEYEPRTEKAEITFEKQEMETKSTQEQSGQNPELLRKATNSTKFAARKVIAQRRILILIDLLRKWILAKWKSVNVTKHLYWNLVSIPFPLFVKTEEEESVNKIANVTYYINTQLFQTQLPQKDRDKTKTAVQKHRIKESERAKKILSILENLRKIASKDLFHVKIDDVMKLSDEEQAISLYTNNLCPDFPSLYDVEGLEGLLPEGYTSETLLRSYGRNGSNCVVQCLSKYERPKKGRPKKYKYVDSGSLRRSTESDI